jgi:hypothetical protein
MNSLPEGARGRVLAVGILLLGLVLLWFGMAAPLLAWHATRQDTLERQALVHDRMRALAEAVPALRKQAAEITDDQGSDGALDGTSDAVAAAGLQQALDDLAKEAGLRIGSAETLPAEPAGAWQAITMRVTLTAPWAPLVQLLRAIAAAPTAMVVDHLQLRPPARNSHDPDWPIEAGFSVTAWRARVAAP